MDIPAIIVLVVAAGLVFDATNGFHDAANAIATVVTTKVLTYRQAVIMAAVMNLLGALIATKVAQTILMASAAITLALLPSLPQVEDDDGAGRQPAPPVNHGDARRPT